MAIEIVTLENNHLYKGNALSEQHKLRFRTIIKRQHWDVPVIRELEYDQYDNPASIYFIWRDKKGVARGSSRLYPTDRPFMLKEIFSHMVDIENLPMGHDVYEGSRFCIDNTLMGSERKQIAQELVLAYLEYGLHTGIHEYIGIMYPLYWKHLFMDIGWMPSWYGEIHITPDGKKSRAGGVTVSEEALYKAREITGISHEISEFRIPSYYKKIKSI